MNKKHRVFGIFTCVCLFSIFVIYILSEASTAEVEVQDGITSYANFPRPEETLLDTLRFTSWDASNTYQPESSFPIHDHTMHEAKVISAARGVADSHGKGSFQSGRHRLLTDGVEYDLQYLSNNKKQVTRVTLFQPLEAPKVIHTSTAQMTKTVNIVLPLQGRYSTISTFIDHLVNKVLPVDPHIKLTVVYFNDHQYYDTRQLLETKLASVDGFKWSMVLVTDSKFSRGRGLQIGVRNATSKPSDLVFFCDVDILIKPDFFSRCRANTVLGYQVYYPIVFSLYNPSLVYPLMDQQVPSMEDQLQVTDKNGFWRDFGFGMACVHRGDLDYQGGLSDVKGWGGEDVSLYEAFLRNNAIKVNRAPDPSLFHVYHTKQCNDVQDISYPSCIRSKALTEGSQLQLGMMLIKLHDGADLEGILSKRYYYFWLVPFFSILLTLSVCVNLMQGLVIYKFFPKRKY